MDIESFTTMTEKLSAEEFVTVMSLFFNHMTDNILSTGGQIDKFIGFDYFFFCHYLNN